MDMEITRVESGEGLRLSEAGAQVDDFIPSAIEKDTKKTSMEGVDGEIFQGSVYRRRTITVPMHFSATDLLDVPLKRDKLFAILNGTEPFYIRELRRPKRQQYAFTKIGEEPKEEEQTSDVYVGGKRYLVITSSISDPNQTERDDGLYVEIEVTFETAELPYAESIGRSKDIYEDGGLSIHPELWSVGMGLQSDPETHRYLTTTSGTHTVFNPSDVPINTFRHDFRVVITLNEDMDELKLIDNYGRELRIERSLQAGDIITIYKGTVNSNGLNVLRDVKRKEFPYLRKGNNTMRIEGGSVDILYDFRFYYH